MRKLVLQLLLLLIASNSYGLLKININKSQIPKIPIAIAEFSGMNNNIAAIISNDLINSGHFSIVKVDAINVSNDNIEISTLKSKKIEAIVFGNIEKLQNNMLNINFYIYDIWTKTSILAKKIIIGKRISRRSAHIISDKIYFAMLGEHGFFDTNIAYVSIDKYNKLPYKLEVVDSDGKNSQIVLASKEPIMSPRWSPDGKKLAYVSFTTGRSKVYIQNIFKNKSLKILPNFDGISSSPSWHPNGKSLLLTISKNGNKDIYRYFLNGGLKRMTTNKSIDTEASFSPDGNSMVWTSNRNGSPQIYLKKIGSNQVSKFSIAGNYNVSPSFSPDGKKIIMIHKEFNEYKVAEFDIATNDLVILTNNALDESPSFAPNGKMVIYSHNRDNKSYLSVVSTDGNYGFKLSDGTKQIREPIWSGFL